jgi:intracellular sulfur oxidation DsrE/DsrF family protein
MIQKGEIMNASVKHSTMNTFYYLVLLTALFIGISCNSSVAAADDEVRKVVYHADFADPRRFSAMLTSINNMVTHYQDELVDYDVRIVFVAHGIRFVTDDKLANTPFAEDAAMADRRDSNKGRLESLRKVQGVKLELCDITRVQIGLPPGKLYEGVSAVTSGVVRIAELQGTGFAYIKIE